jgi:hypothetical protein
MDKTTKTTTHIDYKVDQHILQRIKELATMVAGRVEVDASGKYTAYAYSGDWNRADAAMLHKLTVLWTKYQSGELDDNEAHDAYVKLTR